MLQLTKNLENGRTNVSYHQVSGAGLHASAQMSLQGNVSQWYGRQLPIVPGTPGGPGAETEGNTQSE